MWTFNALRQYSTTCWAVKTTLAVSQRARRPECESMLPGHVRLSVCARVWHVGVCDMLACVYWPLWSMSAWKSQTSDLEPRREELWKEAGMDGKAENVIIIPQLLAGLPRWKEGVRGRGWWDGEGEKTWCLISSNEGSYWENKRKAESEPTLCCRFLSPSLLTVT